MGCSMQLAETISDPKYIMHSELHDLIMIKTQSDALNNCIIIDVRDPLMDYDGGHIHGSVHISHKIFHTKISEIFTNYHAKTKVILYDMYGSISGRSILCAQHYYNYRKEIVANYSRKSEKSYYFVNIFEEDQTNENNKRRIDINCDQEMVSNLQNQQIFVLKGGVFELINSPFANIIHNFDESMWEQLELSALYDQKRWYHKKEYFAKAKFAELKQQTKSTNFRGVSNSSSIGYDNQTAFLQEFDAFEKAFEKTFIEK